MEISITQQAASFAGAVLLGFGVGLFYDILRLVRGRLRARVLRAMLDLLFWIAVTVALFIYVTGMVGGRVRLYVLAALVCGAVMYFLTLSPWLVSLGTVVGDVLEDLVRFCLLPVRFVGNVAKKIKKLFKNLFLYRRKWVRIKAEFKRMGGEAFSEAAQKKEGGVHAFCKSRFADKIADSGHAGRRGSLSVGAQQPRRAGTGRKRRTDAAGGRADSDQC